jgi:hypothetical protein
MMMDFSEPIGLRIFIPAARRAEKEGKDSGKL